MSDTPMELARDIVNLIMESESYQRYKSALEQIISTPEQLEKLKEVTTLKELNDLKEKMQENNNMQKIFKKYKHIDKLDKIIIDTFISKILIGKVDEATKKRDIKIIWNLEI